IDRGRPRRDPELGITYRAAVDMSGGSSDDAVLAIGHTDADGRHIVDLVANQGPPPPFDPRLAITRFAALLKKYNIAKVHGDQYPGNTFRADFEKEGITYDTLALTASQSYEATEPLLNGHRVILPDIPLLEQQFLGLVWRGGKIDHPPTEHDD